MASTIRGNDNFDSAGPFGSLEFISETNITSDVSYIDISFPTGYRAFNIALNQMFRTGNNEPTRSLSAVLKDSSGNLVTTQNSYSFIGFHQSVAYRREDWPLCEMGTNYAGAVTTNVANSAFITINNPRDADVQTSYVCRSGGLIIDSNNIVALAYGANYGNQQAAQEMSGIRLSLNAGAVISSNSHSYTVWGIK